MYIKSFVHILEFLTSEEGTTPNEAIQSEHSLIPYSDKDNEFGILELIITEGEGQRDNTRQSKTRQ